MNKEIENILQSLKEHTWLEYEEMDKLLDYITNLQEIEKEHKNCTRKHWQQKCAKHCTNEMIYKSRLDKAIEYMRSQYTITDDDLYLALYSSDGSLDKLENILRGENND